MVFRKHIEGVAPLGVYLLNKDERVSFAAIDIDIYPLDHKAISRQLMDWSIPVLVCNSKSNGAHLYVFFEEPECPSRVVNSLKLISSALGYRNAEIFPKQTRRHNGQLGNYINLPFFGSSKISENKLIIFGSSTNESKCTKAPEAPSGMPVRLTVVR